MGVFNQFIALFNKSLHVILVSINYPSFLFWLVFSRNVIGFLLVFLQNVESTLIILSSEVSFTLLRSMHLKTNTAIFWEVLRFFRLWHLSEIYVGLQRNRISALSSIIYRKCWQSDPIHPKRSASNALCPREVGNGRGHLWPLPLPKSWITR